MLKTRALGKYVYDAKHFKIDKDNIKAYQGYQQATGIPIYIKIVPIKTNNCMNDNSIPLQTKNQIEAFSSLQHQYISKIIEKVQTGGHLFIVSQRGHMNLFQYLNHKIEQIKIFKIFFDLVIGLYHIHSKGYLHINFTSNNIYINQGQIKIGGISFCVLQSQFTKTNKANLTKNYETLVPQFHKQGKYSQKSMIWNLGIILHQLIFKKYPHKRQAKPNNYIQYNCNQQFQRILTSCLDLDQDSRPNIIQLLGFLLNFQYINEQYQLIIMEKIELLKEFKKDFYYQYIVNKFYQMKQVFNEISYIRFLQRTCFLLKKSQIIINDPPIISLTYYIIMCRLQKLNNNQYWKRNKILNKLKYQRDQINRKQQFQLEIKPLLTSQNNILRNFTLPYFGYRQIIYLKYQAFLRKFIIQTAKILITKQESVIQSYSYTIYSLDFLISLFMLNQDLLSQCQNQNWTILGHNFMNKFSEQPLNLEISKIIQKIGQKLRILGLSDQITPSK